MTSIEAICLYAAISLYACAIAAAVADGIFDFRWTAAAAFWATLVGAGAETVSIALRWTASGHPPVFGTFENALAGSWFLVVAALFLSRRWSSVTSIKFPLALLGGAGLAAIVTIWFGLKFDQGQYPLTISERSLWVDLHATMAWLDYTALFVALLLAVSIISGRFIRETTSDLMAQAMTFAFVMRTAALASGAYYEVLVFGRWWGWDPVESLYLSSWLFAALYIHLRRSFAWTDRSLAVLVVVCFALAIIAYWLLVYFPPGSTFHVFDIRLREHIM